MIFSEYARRFTKGSFFPAYSAFGFISTLLTYVHLPNALT